MYIYMCLHPAGVAFHRLLHLSRLHAPLLHRLVLRAGKDGSLLLANDHAHHRENICIYSTNIHIYLYICTYIYMYAYIHAYIHTYIHTVVGATEDGRLLLANDHV